MKGKPLLLYLKDLYARIPEERKPEARLSFILAAFIAVFSILLLGAKFASFAQTARYNYLSIIVSNSSAHTISVVLGFLLFIVLIVIQVKPRVENEVEFVDERNLMIMKNGTHGTARYKTEQEIREDFSVVPVNKIHSQIYGYLEGSREVVCEKIADNGEVKNNTTIYIGSSGTGKTVSGNLPTIYAAFEQGQSILVSDPKGEMHEKSAVRARELGYKTFVFNLDDMAYSDCWDCLEVIINPETERLDTDKLQHFSSVYMKNINPPDEKVEKFFLDGAENLLSCVIAYAAYRREHAIILALETLYYKIARNLEDFDIKRQEFQEEIKDKSGRTEYNEPSIRELKEIIYDAARRTNHSRKEIDDCIFEIEKEAPVCTIGEAYFLIFNFGVPGVINYGESPQEPGYYNIENTVFSTMPPAHVGVQSYKIFQSVMENPKVSSSIKNNIMQSLNLLMNADLRVLLSNKGINLRNFRKEKTVIYVVFNNRKTNLYPILSLFFSFACDICMDEWKYAENEKNETGKPNPLNEVVFLLDEFASLGRFGGDFDTLENELSTVRSYKIRFIMTIQSLGQLTHLYGEGNDNTILSNCQKVIFLGCEGDKDTSAWISELAGITTALAESHKDKNTPIDGDSTNLTTTARSLFNPDEVVGFKKKKKILLFCPELGNTVTRLDRFPFTDLDYFQTHKLKPVSYKIHKPLRQRMRDSTEHFTIDKTSYKLTDVEIGFDSVKWLKTVKKIISNVKGAKARKPASFFQPSIYDSDHFNSSAEANSSTNLVDFDLSGYMPDLFKEPDSGKENTENLNIIDVSGQLDMDTENDIHSDKSSKSDKKTASDSKPVNLSKRNKRRKEKKNSLLN